MIYIFVHKEEINKSILTYIREKLKQSESYVDDYLVIRFRNYDDIDERFDQYKKFTKENAKAHAKKLRQGSKYIPSKVNNTARNLPFNSKVNEDGLKLYENIIGTSDSFNENETKCLRIKVPFERCFFTEAEIINAGPCSQIDFLFEVLIEEDTYHEIYKHGKSVNASEGYYNRKSSYEAELNEDIYISAKITNTSGARKIGLNVVLHEVKNA